MKIAIHHKKGSFSNRWITYCKDNDVDFKIVNCYDNDIIEQLKDCDALMWHHHHGDYKDVLFAKGLLFSLQQAGIRVFPDFNTGWHFDDKVGQKYLLEAINAPMIPAYVFYDKTSALKWVDETSYPKVFKLRGGAGAANVSLVKNKREAVKKINKAFGKGYSQFNRVTYLKERFNKMLIGKDNLLGVMKSIARLVIPTEYAKMGGREKGYVYFQEFVPHNNFDLRVIVIGEKAFAVKRMVRENDFRASGSGNAKYSKDHIDIRCVEIAFDINKKIKAQSIGYDFVFDQNNNPQIVEFGYGFAISFYDPCPGYWDSSLEWHEGKFNPQEWMLQNMIKSLK